MLSAELRVKRAETADMVKESKSTENKYAELPVTRVLKYELRRPELNRLGSISFSARACAIARQQMQTETWSWCRAVQLSTDGKRIAMKAAWPPALEKRSAPVKKEPRPEKITIANSATSPKPTERSSFVAMRIAVSEMMDEPVAIDSPKSPFRATAKIHPQTDDT